MHQDVAKIRDLNDRFRRGDPSVPGEVLLTPGICELIDGSLINQALLLSTIRAFDAFTEDNDPYGEHDFGAFMLEDQKCFWKLDVYDPKLEMAALDATDVALSRRVLTVMLVTEY